MQAQVNVLITSPAGYSGRFERVFSESRLTPVVIPVIETVIRDNMPGIDSLMANLHRYEYIAFSSRKAIESFHGKWSSSKTPLGNIKFCAIGRDAEYMHEMLGVRPSVYPDEPSPAGIARKLGESSGISGKTIAVLVPLVEDTVEPDVVPDFITRLEGIGMAVTRINAYVTKPADAAQVRRAVDLIASKKVNCVAFTSSAEVDVLLQDMDNRRIMENVTVACFGPYTAAYARKKGLDVSVVASDFSSFSGFLKAIEEHF
ncbi:MAG: uroporphyrinogen-III synthase [Bacteroidales bacterium]|nr:uroporphyrinogen-III synthase [Bacteroidales bacterium]